MKVADSGFVFDYDVPILLCQPDIPISGSISIHDVRKDTGFEIHFYKQHNEDSEGHGAPHIFLFSSIEDSWGYFKGLCLTWLSDNGALHVRLRKPFIWQYKRPNDTVRKGGDITKSYVVESPIAPEDISPQYPLIIDMGK